MTRKEKLITFGIGLGVILLCPFPTRIAQSLQLEFSGKDLRPLTGMRVSQSWETYGLFGSGREEQSVEPTGPVNFPARYAYGSIATRCLAQALTVIAVHSSYGGRVTFEFTLPASVEITFAEPAFSSLQQMDTSGHYRGADMRYYYWTTTPQGKRIMVSGDFNGGATTLRFPIREPNQSSSEYAKFRFDSRLMWCIDQVNQGKVYRNMPLNELKGIFKEKLLGEGLTPNGERYFSSILDKDYRPSDGPRQFARTWIIEFKVSKSDRVTDYSITMSGEQ
ncbi:MAG: hypothetical protein RL091_3399 [Verrucomicrobiota bacterium]